MTTLTATQNLQRAARAYRLALATRDDATKIAAEFPKVAGKLEEVAKLLVAAGREAEAASNGKES